MWGIKGLIERLLEWDDFGGSGRGWDREANMSVNAVDAYEFGAKPISQWNKTDIIKYMAQEGANSRVIQAAKELTIKWLKILFLDREGWHHIGKRYKKVDFHRVKVFDAFDKEFFSEMRYAFYHAIIFQVNKDFYLDKKIQGWVGKYLGRVLLEALLELSDIYREVSYKSIPKDYHERFDNWKETYGDSGMYIKPFA
ncbi:MAG: hypothetical protein EOM67_13895 [Spirochaetia bacterium]|nr:hypothetical protein [Spirochaetia bacterium]